MPGVRNDLETLYKKEMYKAVMDAAKRRKVEPVFPRVFKVVNGVNGAGDKEDQLLGMGDLKRLETETESIDYNAPTVGWTSLVAYFRWTDGLALSFEQVQDVVKGNSNIVKTLTKTWDASVIRAKETWAAQVFNNGGALLGDEVFNGTHTGNVDSSGDLLYDSKPFFNLSGNNRTIKGSSDTYYNAVSGLTLSASTFETMYILMTTTNAVDELGAVINNEPDTVLTRAGVDAKRVWEILETQGKNRSYPDSSINNANPFANDKSSWTGVMNKISWRYLTDASFYLGKAQSENLQFHERMAPVIDTHIEPGTKVYKADIMVRFGTWIKDWRDWVKAGGTFA